MTKAKDVEQRRRDLITGQLAYMLDELGALSVILKTFPAELLEAQPFEGEPSVRDLFTQLSARETAIRIPNIERFIDSEEASPTLFAVAGEVGPDDANTRATADVLDEVAAARRHLLELVRSADDEVWDKAARQEGAAITMRAYLFRVVQEDVELLRTVAQRIHESRPVGSPGFTAR